jgi:hypothetical protein
MTAIRNPGHSTEPDKHGAEFDKHEEHVWQRGTIRCCAAG